MKPQKEADRISGLLESVGVQRVITPPADQLLAQAKTGEFAGSVVISTVGPYNPDLLSEREFAGEKRMIDGYLKIHSKLVRERIPSIMVVRDEFARGLRLESTGEYASELNILELVRRLTDYAVTFISEDSGSHPTQNLFQVVRESQYSDFNSIEVVRALDAFDLTAQKKNLAKLDIRTGLDLVGALKKMSEVQRIGRSLFGSDYLPILLEWEGTVQFWQEAGVAMIIPVAEVVTIKGPRDTRKFCHQGLKKLG
jgi:hypothetical protein